MRRRPRFNLRRPLFAWNLALSLFSAIGTWRIAVPFAIDIVDVGWERALCSFDYDNAPQCLWYFLFGLSKPFELIDTLFVVLRKQEIIFLHWYHHATVLCYCWWTLADPCGLVRLFCAMNYAVHTIMYAYYAIRAQGLVRLPRFVNVFITIVQIAQMGVGWAACVDGVVRIRRRGFSCDTELRHMYWPLVMYTSYFLLFVYFFYQRYFK